MGDTSISWTEKTWNVTRGCRRVSPGCEHCYAERQANRFKGPGGPYEGLIKLVGGKPRWSGETRFAVEHLADPLRWKRPRRIFVDSMSDLFYEGFTNEQIAAVFGVMAACPRHTFQILTKRAKRMREWFEWLSVSAGGCGYARIAFCILKASEQGCWNGIPYVTEAIRQRIERDEWPLPNVWLGVSVENQAAADERIPELLATPAAVRFLSCEPLLGAVNLHEYLLGFAAGHPASCACGHGHGFTRCPNYGGVAADCHRAGCTCSGFVKAPGSEGLSWLIAGCESGPGARPCSVEWLRSLRDQCEAAGVPYFLKQAVESDMGKCGDADNPNGEDPCGKPVRYYVHGPKDSSVSCGCTVEGSEDANGCPPIGAGEGSKRKAGGVIELPYLDGVQHAAFPEVRR